MFAAKSSWRFDSNQEFLGLQQQPRGRARPGLPVSGGMSQSLVNESGGARTPVSGLVAAGLILMVSVFPVGLLRNLPKPVLAAIVLVAVADCSSFLSCATVASGPRRICHRDCGSDGRARFGLLRGVLMRGDLASTTLAAWISATRGLPRQDPERSVSRPRAAHGQFRYPRRTDLSRRSELLYFNIEYIREAVMDRARSEPTPPELVLCDSRPRRLSPSERSCTRRVG